MRHLVHLSVVLVQPGFSYLPSHVVGLLLARDRLQAQEVTKFQVTHIFYTERGLDLETALRPAAADRQII